MAGRRGFGAIRRLPSGRFQAGYVGPDMVRHKAATTFETREDAEGGSRIGAARSGARTGPHRHARSRSRSVSTPSGG